MTRRLAILFLLFSALPAFAGACGDHDLLRDLKETDPSAYAALSKDQMINGEAILWKVEKDGVAPSYLFGTMHVADPRITTLSDKVEKAIAASERLMLEIDMSKQEMEATTATFMSNNIALFMAPQGQQLADLLNDEEEKAATEALAKVGMPFWSVNPMQPWFPALLLALPSCSGLGLDGADAEVLDGLVRGRFVEAGKRTMGLETVEEQLRTMAELDMDTQLIWLKSQILMADKMDALFETMTRVYLRRELPLFMAYSETLLSEEGNAANARVYDALLDQRNVRMFERSKEEVAKGGLFLAVGALHLPGETGLVNLYREAGYTVTALD